MNKELMDQLTGATERLAVAAAALEQTIARIEAEHQALAMQLDAKIERIVATVDESDASARKTLEERVTELVRANEELRAQAARASAQRKTLPPLVTAILAKTCGETPGYEAGGRIDAGVLDKSLAALSVEQRIAVKSEMARAGLIE
jgi:hypothetical protein